MAAVRGLLLSCTSRAVLPDTPLPSPRTAGRHPCTLRYSLQCQAGSWVLLDSDAAHLLVALTLRGAWRLLRIVHALPWRSFWCMLPAAALCVAHGCGCAWWARPSSTLNLTMHITAAPHPSALLQSHRRCAWWARASSTPLARTARASMSTSATTTHWRSVCKT